MIIDDDETLLQRRKYDNEIDEISCFSMKNMIMMITMKYPVAA